MDSFWLAIVAISTKINFTKLKKEERLIGRITADIFFYINWKCERMWLISDKYMWCSFWISCNSDAGVAFSCRKHCQWSTPNIWLQGGRTLWDVLIKINENDSDAAAVWCLRIASLFIFLKLRYSINDYLRNCQKPQAIDFFQTFALNISALDDRFAKWYVASSPG